MPNQHDASIVRYTVSESEVKVSSVTNNDYSTNGHGIIMYFIQCHVIFLHYVLTISPLWGVGTSRYNVALSALHVRVFSTAVNLISVLASLACRAFKATGVTHLRKVAHLWCSNKYIDILWRWMLRGSSQGSDTDVTLEPMMIRLAKHGGVPYYYGALKALTCVVRLHACCTSKRRCVCLCSNLINKPLIYYYFHALRVKLIKLYYKSLKAPLHKNT